MHSLIGWYIKKRLDEIYGFIETPITTQEDQLFGLVEQGLQTEWGKSHFFKDIHSAQDFSEAQPISTYENIKPLIQKSLDGAQRVLWNTPINWYAKSSGTSSGKSKFIPVTKAAMDAHYTGARDLMAFYLMNNPKTNVFGGKGIVLGGSHDTSEWSDDVRYGDLSAVLMQNLNPLPRFLSALSPSTAVMKDWEQKLEAITNETLPKRITHLAGVPTWTLLLVKKVLQKTGKSFLKEVWPDLDLFIHGGVSFVPYENEFRALFGPGDYNFIQTYNASEGFFALQDRLKSDDMLLMLDYGVYYEFLPMSELGKKDARAINLSDVKVGVNYAIIISTNAGLWRYQIGDTIKFTSTNPFRIKITGRVTHFINVFGEEVIVANTDSALAETCKRHNASVREYSVAPVFLTADRRGGHEWLIEFEKMPEELSQFEMDLDQALQSLNSDYESKRRKNMALKNLKITVAPSGTFYRWLKRKNKMGGQHKVPRLSNSRKHIEEISARVLS